MAENLDCPPTGRTPHFVFTANSTANNKRPGAMSDGQRNSPGRSVVSSHRGSNIHPIDAGVNENPNAGGMPAGQVLDTSGMTFQQLSDQVKILMAITLENKNTNVSLAKRYKAERDWGSLGNKAQYTINTSIITLLDEAVYSLSVNNFVNTQNCLIEARTLMEERNKHVIMADTSEFGWATVNAYLNMNVSLDEDEDKRFKRAENFVRTSRKSKQESTPKTVRGRGNGRGRSSRGGHTSAQPQPQVSAAFAPPYNPYVYGSMYSPEMYSPQFQQMPFPAFAGHFPGTMYNAMPKDKSTVRCHGCNQFGHYKNACPYAQTGYTNIGGNGGQK